MQVGGERDFSCENSRAQLVDLIGWGKKFQFDKIVDLPLFLLAADSISRECFDSFSIERSERNPLLIISFKGSIQFCHLENC